MQTSYKSNKGTNCKRNWAQTSRKKRHKRRLWRAVFHIISVRNVTPIGSLFLRIHSLLPFWILTITLTTTTAQFILQPFSTSTTPNPRTSSSHSTQPPTLLKCHPPPGPASSSRPASSPSSYSTPKPAHPTPSGKRPNRSSPLAKKSTTGQASRF